MTDDVTDPRSRQIAVANLNGFITIVVHKWLLKVDFERTLDLYRTPFIIHRCTDPFIVFPGVRLRWSAVNGYLALNLSSLRSFSLIFFSFLKINTKWWKEFLKGVPELSIRSWVLTILTLMVGLSHKAAEFLLRTTSLFGPFCRYSSTQSVTTRLCTSRSTWPSTQLIVSTVSSFFLSFLLRRYSRKRSVATALECPRHFPLFLTLPL